MSKWYLHDASSMSKRDLLNFKRYIGVSLITAPSETLRSEMSPENKYLLQTILNTVHCYFKFKETFPTLFYANTSGNCSVNFNQRTFDEVLTSFVRFRSM